MSRVNEMIYEFGGVGRNEDGSITRLGSSNEFFVTLEKVKALMDELGMKTEKDPVGNLHAVLPGTDENAKSIVIGSHLDTVIKGGMFDGMLGVAGSLEVVCRLKEQNRKLRHPIELWGFNMEESSPLGGTFGSRCVTGFVDPTMPGYEKNLAHYGMTPENVVSAKRDLKNYGCYLEYHIEQGDKLDTAGLELGVVSGIVGVVRYEVTAAGISNHAGTTMMPNRRDALVGMSKLIVEAEAKAREIDDTLVFTVGKMEVFPGQENVIPNEVVATFEMRHMDKAVTDRFMDEIRASAEKISNCDFTFKSLVAKYSTPCDPKLIRTIDEVCKRLGINHIVMPSGAGHDANAMAKEGVPIGMIFAPSVKGISHHGDEWTKPEHVDLGADVLYETVLALDEMDF